MPFIIFSKKPLTKMYNIPPVRANKAEPASPKPINTRILTITSHHFMSLKLFHSII